MNSRVLQALRKEVAAVEGRGHAGQAFAIRAVAGRAVVGKDGSAVLDRAALEVAGSGLPCAAFRSQPMKEQQGDRTSTASMARPILASGERTYRKRYQGRFMVESTSPSAGLLRLRRKKLKSLQPVLFPVLGVFVQEEDTLVGLFLAIRAEPEDIPGDALELRLFLADGQDAVGIVEGLVFLVEVLDGRRRTRAGRRSSSSLVRLVGFSRVS